MGRNSLFSVSVNKYDDTRNFRVTTCASLEKPRNQAVMFITAKHVAKVTSLAQVEGCLVFWPKDTAIPKDLEQKHVFAPTERPRLEFCRFFEENGIRSLPLLADYDSCNGALVAKTAIIGDNTIIMPGAVIGPEVVLGKNVFVGAGAKITCRASIGNYTIIRENVVIGSDGLACETDYDGHHIWFPQFGGAVIGDNVSLGAGVVVERGALDNTIIGDGVKIDSAAIVSHNCFLSPNSILCAGVVLCGSVKIGRSAYIAPSSTVLNQLKIGDNAYVGVASNVLRKVKDGQRVFGNPATPILF